jgi:F-type H+-transporting ATPase subunit a
MKIFYSLFLFLFFSKDVYASGGFTWISSVQHSLGTHLPEHILTYAVDGLFLVLFGVIYRSKLSGVVNLAIPDRGITIRNVSELYGQFIYNQCKAVIGEKEAEKYFGFISTIFILILLSNLIGLVPGFLPPTEYLNTTLALGAFSFIYYNVVGCKEMGTINYLKHFAGPLWYMAILIFPIEIISNFIRPVSLALRLRGNMYGDHLVLSKFTELVPLVVPIAAMLLGLLVCFIQAYVFTVLTMVYISLATAHHDHDEEHAH